MTTFIQIQGYAGQNKVNPTTLFLSGAMMLRYLGEPDADDRLQKAVEDVIGEGTQVIGDLAPAGATSVSTQEIAEAIADKLTQS